MSTSPPAILFYDGECGFCARSVHFLLQQDRHAVLSFAPLQGETAAYFLDAKLRESLATVVYRRLQADGQMEQLLRSDAVLCAIIDIRSPWRWLAYPARWIPRCWRDAIYDWIAGHRQRLFSKKSCVRPTSKKRSQFLP